MTAPKKRRTKKDQNLSESFYEKVLCFTTSYRRPYMLYNCIRGILNQTLQNFHYCVNINVDTDRDRAQYEALLKDFIGHEKLTIIFSDPKSQHENYLAPILHHGRDAHNLFVKIDDDDVYAPTYLEKAVALFKEKKVDILSFALNKVINGPTVNFGHYDAIGVWQPDLDSDIKFGMPCTYIFNQSALNILVKLSSEDVAKIHAFEDPAWRTAWREAGLKSVVINDWDLATYHVHGKNSSSSYMYEDKSDHSATDVDYMENDHFILALFQHKWWSSYMYLNKRNNRLYHINNDDHGAFMMDEDKCKVTWDNWGDETFERVAVTKNKYRFVLK